MTTPRSARGKGQKMTASESARQRSLAAIEEQFRQLEAQNVAREELWVLMDQFEQLSIHAGRQLQVLHDTGMDMSDLLKTMGVPRSMARMFLEAAAKHTE